MGSNTINSAQTGDNKQAAIADRQVGSLEHIQWQDEWTQEIPGGRDLCHGPGGGSVCRGGVWP